MTIIVPCLNEEIYIEKAIASLRPPNDDLDYEIIVLDGGSTDKTREVVGRLSHSDGRIRLVSNEKTLQSAGVNKGATMADPRAAVMVRADCHAGYPPDFVRRLVDEMRRSGASSVVVPMQAEGSTCMQRAIAAAQNSKLGTGGSPHRSKSSSRFIDHGHHAAFDLATFRDVGGYDETFSHNEDAEYDYRLVKGGGRVWLCADLAVTYYPRRDLWQLARQYFNHGKGRARTVFKHSIKPKPRQLVPVAVLAMVVASISLSVATDSRWLVPPALYALTCLIAGVLLAWRQRDWCVALSGCAAMVMHLSWAVGFLRAALSSKVG